MKVCMVTTGPVQGAGGVENVAKSIMEKLGEAGIETASVHAYEKYSGPVRSVLSFKNVLKKVEKLQPDIIHTHDNAGYWIAKAGLKYVHTSHGTWVNYFSAIGGVKNRILSRLIISMERFIVKNAAVNTAVSNFVGKSVAGQYKTAKKIHVILNGVDTAKFRPVQKRGDDRTALWVGTNPELKGLNTAIKAAEIAGVKLIVAGVAGKSTGTVKYVGRVKPAAMPKIYSSASVLLFPSRYESYPIVPLEAMASGLPVVVSDAAHVEIMKSGREGIIVKSDSADDYAEALSRAFDNMRGLEKNARKTAEKYDWSRQAKLYIRIYEKFL